MKDYKRLKVGARMGNTPSGLVAIDLVDFDGGMFNLQPKIYDGGLVLVDPSRPGSYGLQITGTPETLNSFAKAVQAAARASGSDDDDGSE